MVDIYLYFDQKAPRVEKASVSNLRGGNKNLMG